MNISFRRPALLALALACLVATGSAQDHLRLKGGKSLRGKATAYDAATETVTFVTDDGKTHQLKAKDLDQGSAYSLAKSRATKGDGRDQLKLGNFARDIELYAHAARHYRQAEKDDPSLKAEIEPEFARLRTEAADFCMRMAQEAANKKDMKGAEKWLTTLVNKLPNEPQAAQASSLLQEYYAKNHAAKDDELEKEHAEVLAKDLKVGKKAYDNMLEDIQKGLANTRSTSASKKLYESAWKNGEKALKELDKIQKKRGPDDPKLAELFDGYRVLIKEHMVDSRLHLASAYTVETAYQRAIQSVNMALSIDSGNQKALAARARIEEAASNDGILGW